MSEQLTVNPNTLVRVQKGEIDRINDNRLFLLALLEDTQVQVAALSEKLAEARAEIGTLTDRLEQAQNQQVVLAADEIDEN